MHVFCVCFLIYVQTEANAGIEPQDNLERGKADVSFRRKKSE
jgi:hypothetical protein